ncbi:organoarsenical effux MFS transporter ArsJ [Gallaecimonas kandeliae]|uniref:organoarsenical effux MFS transporter ArsJ n=1 Tax=Gallaecimonas kandeliae TaxID=3029055 RepID=UPI00264713C9|nr:organoarsenical effux MFS transporter ArsJ [Gallaecimonas kandeliae]WKE67091.1 organoarsenical effux MFS transporter ArsJ [Gallaecimonas kandeliae]
MLASLSPMVRQYLLVTGNYWAFTLTDGALRMLVVLHFAHLGYSPLAIAMLFLFYEFFGVVTNLVGGWLGARLGLNNTMNLGLGLQVLALCMLLPPSWLTVPWVMAAQALSGIAKDLNKMSAKSSIKLLAGGNSLYHWVAVLTGSKNALKGVGFFLGAALLALLGFQGAIAAMAAVLALVWLASLVFLRADLGRAKNKPKFTDIFSKSRSVNLLSAARFFLFGARDLWFVVALPVFLADRLGWNNWQVGSFLALWVMGYGAVQALAPKVTGATAQGAARWAAPLTLVPVAIALELDAGWPPGTVLVAGLALFGVLFALNSALHSFLIVHLAEEDGVSLDVGFYYMANAMGRLVGTVLSGALYQWAGLEACLWFSAAFLLAATLVSTALPRH